MFGGLDAAALRAAALEAAVDDSRWPGLIEPLLSDFAAIGAVLGVVDRRSGAMIHAGMIGFAGDLPAVWREYVEETGADDTQVRMVMTGSGARCFADGDHVDPGDARAQAYLAWQEARLGSRHHITFAGDISPDIVVGLSLHRSRAAGHAGAAERARIAMLQRILMPGLRLGLAHGDALTEGYWEGAVARVGEMAAMLNEHGRVLRLTAALEVLVREARMLSISGGRLRARAADRDAMLQGLIADAVSRRSASPGALLITGPDGRRCVVNVHPLSFDQRFLAQHRAAALVFVADAEPQPADPALLRGAFGLTEREAMIAARLGRGEELAEIAAELAISRETARVHLRNIFAKTGTNRQSGLVRLVSLIGR